MCPTVRTLDVSLNSSLPLSRRVSISPVESAVFEFARTSVPLSNAPFVSWFACHAFACHSSLARVALVLFFVLLGVFDRSDSALIGQESPATPVVLDIGNDLVFREHRPGMWSYICPEIKNPTSNLLKAKVVAFFESAKNRQFEKELEIPASSALRTTIPIFVPRSSKSSSDIQVQLWDVGGAEPKLILNNGVRSYQTSVSIRGVSLAEGSRYHSSALLDVIDTDAASNSKRQAYSDAEELLFATRIYTNQNARIGKSTGFFLPSTSRAFESVSQIVIHNDRLRNDAAGMTAVRRWLGNGGDLWIMLDLVSAETVAQLLGDGLPFRQVDRTSLTTVQLVDADPESVAAPQPPREFEKPIDFVRVVLDGATPHFSVEGWPAIFSSQFGKGRIMFTAVGANALMRRRTSEDPPGNSRLGISDYLLVDSMEAMAYQMLVDDGNVEELTIEELQAELVNQIGYRIISQRNVMIILAVYSLLLLLTGCWLVQKQRLDWLLFIGPIFAILAACVFLLVGYQNSRVSPPTFASFQQIAMLPGSSELQVRGLGVLYSQTQQSYPLGGTNDGQMRGIVENNEDQNEKISWDKNGDWKFAGGKIEPGIRVFSVTSNISAPQKMFASVTFDENGLVGVIESNSLLKKLGDIVIACPKGRYFSATESTVGLSFGKENELPDGQFVGSNLISDQQRWHQSVYAALFPIDQSSRWVSDYSLFGWAPPLELDLTIPPEYERTGGALVRIPLRITAPEKGTKIFVPAAFIDLQSVRFENLGVSSIYKSKTREWNGSIQKKSDVKLRFQFPREVLPMKIESAKFSIKRIFSPYRDVTIRFGNQGEILAKLSEPTGRFERTITDLKLLTLDENGQIEIAIESEVYQSFFDERSRVTDITQRKELPRDNLDDIRLEVTGTFIGN